MRWVSDDEVRQRLDLGTAIRLVGAALASYQRGEARTSPRVIDESGTTALAVMAGSVPGLLGLKTLSINSENRSRGLPTIQGVVVGFRPDTGEVLGALAGATLTRVRTAAVAGYATDVLAPEGASTMLLAGAGAQAPDQVEAVLAVRPIRHLLLWNRTRARAEQLGRRLAADHPQLTIEVVDAICRAREADIVSLVTSSREPVLQLDDLGTEWHVNAMGSFAADMRELASDVVAASDVYADTLAGCLHEAGDLLMPIAEGRIRPESVRELAGARGGRGRRTVMKSVGSALFDLACASWLLAEEPPAGSELADFPGPDDAAVVEVAG